MLDVMKVSCASGSRPLDRRVDRSEPAPVRFGFVAFFFGGIVAGRATSARLNPRVALLVGRFSEQL
jgi:hypothetical protein